MDAGGPGPDGSIFDATSPSSDTYIAKDTTPPPPPPPPGCAINLPLDFACFVPPTPTGGKVCSEDVIQAFVKACFSPMPTPDCGWLVKKDHYDCYSCLGNFGSPAGTFQSGFCMLALAPSSICGKAMLCENACIGEVCADCLFTPGSGKSPTTSERWDCASDARFEGSSTQPKGRCYDVATGDTVKAGCRTTPPTAGCTDPVQFYRGACRDGGDWTNMTSPTPK